MEANNNPLTSSTAVDRPRASASAAIRWKDDSSDHGEYRVVGGCGNVKEEYSHGWDTPQDKMRGLNEDESCVYLHIDINTLMALTLNSLDLVNETLEARRISQVHKV